MREAWGREDVHLLLLLGAFWVAHTALQLSAACGLQFFVCTQLGSLEGRLWPATLGLGRMRPPVLNCLFAGLRAPVILGAGGGNIAFPWPAWLMGTRLVPTGPGLQPLPPTEQPYRAKQLFAASCCQALGAA